MRPSDLHPALITVLLAAILLVLFADILTVSAAADPTSAASGAVLSPISPSSISRPYTQLTIPLKPAARPGRTANPGRSRRHPPTRQRSTTSTPTRRGRRGTRCPVMDASRHKTREAAQVSSAILWTHWPLVFANVYNDADSRRSTIDLGRRMAYMAHSASPASATRNIHARSAGHAARRGHAGRTAASFVPSAVPPGIDRASSWMMDRASTRQESP